ncbi:unnamed protein product [Ranitomeya imitator]|uniref:Piwi domain-containing protein n=1 Tax=Ranitomeya imitator TaxID=111125 RepID=A0ABN9L9E3_9NEOB|nr:unnamed protein product [Ranitomeya imitator]
MAWKFVCKRRCTHGARVRPAALHHLQRRSRRRAAQNLRNYEVPHFMDCIKSAKQNYSPRLTMVVKKRINTRFFASSQLQNPPQGITVDGEVTRSEWYDFISQSVRQGTVSPTYYNIVYDTGGLKPDHMQRLNYKPCHQYFVLELSLYLAIRSQAGLSGRAKHSQRTTQFCIQSSVLPVEIVQV